MTLERDCPICNSENKTLSREYQGYSIGTCNQCGFLYVFNPDENTASEANSSEDQGKYTRTPAPRRRHKYITNLIERRIENRAEVLEIGTGYGALGKLLDERGHNYLGFEPSNVRANVANNDGLNVINDTFDPSRINQSYDTIVIDNVLEHIHNPAQVVNEAAKALHRDGFVIVIVPSRKDIRRLHPDWNASHFWIPSAHINFFRPVDIDRVFSMAGLQMKPFPPSVFGTKNMKGILFKLKATFELLHYYPLSLYVIGELNE